MRTTLLNPCLFRFKCLVGFSGDYTIPDGVTSIGDRAFTNCRSLTSVTIPDSVTSIGTWAFCGCSALTSVTIPDSVTSIGELAFFGCTALTSINVHPDNMKYASVGGVLFNKACTVLMHCPKGYSGVYKIPDSVTSIGNAAFSFCTALTSVSIPARVTSISDGAFHGCTALTSVTIPAGVTTIAAFSGCTGLTSVTIPDGVTTIGGFRGCTALTSVTIPDSVTTIDDSAFHGCTALDSVIIPDNVTSIGEYAFHDCRSLASVLFIGDAPTISKRSNVFNDTPFVFPDAFGGNTPAKIYYLPGTSGWGTTYDGRPAKPLLTYAQENGGIRITGIDTSFTGKILTISGSLAGHPVTSIGDSAFCNRRTLTSVTIPERVTSIGDSASAWCRSLTSVSIPASVTSIGKHAFDYCASLTSINVDHDNMNYASVIGVLFDKELTVLVKCPSGLSGAYTIPDSITSIGDWAFYNCTSLTSVTIPDGVTSIGGWAFYNCCSLTSVSIPASVTSIGKHAFDYCASLASVLFTGDAPTIFSNDVDDIPHASPKAFFNTRAKIYFRPGTSGWGDTPKEKMIFKSAEVIAAYADKHHEAMHWDEGKDYEIVPGEAAPATEAAPEPTVKQEANLTEDIIVPPLKKPDSSNVKHSMASPQSLPVVECSRIGIFPSSTQAGVIGHDFCYDWQRVQAAAQKQGCNLDAFLTAPLAKRLTVKQLKTPVTFWFTPLGKLFVITVCSAKNVDFFDPLHGMRGYVEYGGNHLRPMARPFLQWDGSRVIRVHALEAKLESPFLVADFGNNFGLTVSEIDEVNYRQIQDDPAGHFAYAAVPSATPTTIMRSTEAFEVHHALCVSRWT